MLKKITQYFVLLLIFLFNQSTFANLSSTDKLVFVLENGYGKQKISKLVISDIDGKNAEVLTETQGTIYSLSASTDYQSLIFTEQIHNELAKVYQLTIANKNKQLLTPNSVNHFGASLSPDNKQLLVSHSGSGNADIYLMDLATKNSEKITTNTGLDIAPIWLPNQTGFLFTSASENGKPNIYYYNLDNKMVKPLELPTQTSRIARISPNGNWLSWVGDDSQVMYAPLQLSIKTDETKMVHIAKNNHLYDPVNFSPDSRAVIFPYQHFTNGITMFTIGKNRQYTIQPLQNMTTSTGESLGEGRIVEPIWIQIGAKD